MPGTFSETQPSNPCRPQSSHVDEGGKSCSSPEFSSRSLLFSWLRPSPRRKAPSRPILEIAHIAYTAGVIDIKAAQLALKKSKNRNVIAFAKDMVRDHGAVNQKALGLVKKLNVTPEDNDTSKSLVQKADEERTKLSKLRGSEFDKAYAANEVAYHRNGQWGP